MIKKALFKYKKEDGSLSERELLNPSFLKESSNSLKSFEQPSVKYVSGFELQKEGLTKEVIELYKTSIAEYYSNIQITLEEHLESIGLDPKKVIFKSFKKEGIEKLELSEE